MKIMDLSLMGLFGKPAPHQFNLETVATMAVFQQFALAKLGQRLGSGVVLSGSWLSGLAELAAFTLPGQGS
jgi:hypothetical protein